MTVVIETLTFGITGGLAYHFLATQKMEHFKEVLSAETELLASALELDANQAIKSSLPHFVPAPLTSFQVLDHEGRVLWDTVDHHRVGKLVLNQHELYQYAKKAASPRGELSYRAFAQQDRYWGIFRRVSTHYIILSAISTEELQAEIERTAERFFYLVLLCYGLSVLAIVFMARELVRPIRALTQAASQIAEGNFDIEIAKPSRDEVGRLSESFQLMTRRLQALLEGEAQNYRMENEVVGVAELQSKLLPASDIDQKRFEVRSYYQSATETGGDYWGYFETETHFLIYVGDATGHGLPSAMLTAAARGCFSAVHQFYREHPLFVPTPAEFLSYANQAVMEVSQGELQMTMFACVYSYAEKNLAYCNAGHNPAWLFRTNHAEPVCEVLRSRGPRLGESVHFSPGETQFTQMNEDDFLFLYSDGLIEIRNDQDQALGKEKLRECLLAQSPGKKSLKEQRDRLIALALEQGKGNVPEDDITFSLLRFKP